MSISRQKIELLNEMVQDLPVPDDYFKGCFSPSLEIPNNLLIFHRKQSKDLGTEYFYHYRFVLILNLQTKGTVVLDDQSFEFCPGEALLVFPYQFHHYLEPDKKDIGWLFITFELENPDPLTALKNNRLSFSTKAWSYIHQLIDLYGQRNENKQTTYAPILLLTGLILQELLLSGTNEAGEKTNVQPSIVDDVNRYIWDNYNRNIGLEDIAKNFSYSTSHLRFIFRKKMGMSIGSYIQKVKINRARSLLINSGLNVSEIAAACGYESLFSFSRAFKKKTGLSPIAYKKTIQKK